MNFPAIASFGAGRLIGTPAVTTGIAEPLEFGVLQEVGWDFQFTTKPLYGQNQHAIFVARAEGKFTGKAKWATLSGDIIGQLFFGATPTTTGETQLQTDVKQVPGSVAYTVTPTPPNSGTWVSDQGVQYVGGGDLVRVASGPTQGQYSVAAGVYTFAAADANANVNISYLFSESTPGQIIQITNQIMGTTPYFSMVFRNRDPNNGLFNTMVFNKCTSDKLSLPGKVNDYSIPEFDFQVMDDGTGNIGTWTFGDKN